MKKGEHRKSKRLCEIISKKENIFKYFKNSFKKISLLLEEGNIITSDIEIIQLLKT